VYAGVDYEAVRSSRAATAGVVVAVLALGVAGFALVGERRHAAELAALRGDVHAAEARLAKRSARLAGEVDATERRIDRREAGVAPLAHRVLTSVFTVETDTGLGTGFVAWRDGGATYLVTAAHVVAEASGAFVTVSRKGGSWTAEIVRVDRSNDLAVVRISGRPAGAAPLWQTPRRSPPRVGDQLLLVGSPFGLEGTVTTGVVSRVTRNAIQTDAAANPGNSGGPALDKQGHIVGVLVAGGGQNVNFAVPIAKACSSIRHC
jgi:serine protease Do